MHNYRTNIVSSHVFVASVGAFGARGALLFRRELRSTTSAVAAEELARGVIRDVRRGRRGVRRVQEPAFPPRRPSATASAATTAARAEKHSAQTAVTVPTSRSFFRRPLRRAGNRRSVKNSDPPYFAKNAAKTHAQSASAPAAHASSIRRVRE